MADKFKPCAVEGCKGNALRAARGERGWCGKHYQKWVKYGDPLAGFEMATRSGDRMRWIMANKEYDGDDCLKWPFCTNGQGYGMSYYGGRHMKASRIMCILAHGDPPTPKHEAAHSCGNGHLGCTNPKHLRWATSKENSADAIRHGTTNRGKRCNFTKLTEDQVREIRRLAETQSYYSIGPKFGITPKAVSFIARRINWAWLD